MDKAAFLQQLRAGDLEVGKRSLKELYQQQTIDHDLIGNMLADEALARLYSPFLSLKLAELLIFFGAYARHLPSHALGLKAKGDALVQMRFYQTALDSLDASAEEFLLLDDKENWARTRISWIVAATSLGRVEDALNEATRAREVFQELAQPYWVCVVDHNTAWAYRQVGRYQEAQRLYEQMLTIYPTLQDRSDVFIERAIAMAKGSMAVNLSWLGDFAQASRLEQEALATYRALGELDMAVNAEITLADFDYNRGYYGSALQQYYHAQDFLGEQQIDSPKIEAYLKLQIANTLIKLNRAGEARPLAHAAVEIYRQSGFSLDAMNALRDYATVLAASKRTGEALEALDEAESLFARSGLEHHTLITRLQRCEVFLQMQRFAEAYQSARPLLDIFERQGLVARSVHASLILVEALLGQAEQQRESEQRARLLQEAETIGKQAALKAQRAHLQEEVYRSQALLGRLFALSGENVKALRRYKAAIERIERILNDLLYDLSPSFLSTAWSVYAETIALYLQQGRNELAFHYLERARSMALRQYLKRAPARQGESEAEASDELREKQSLSLRTQEELKTWQERYHKQSLLLEEGDFSFAPELDQQTLREELKRCETRINELFERLYLQQSAGLLTVRQQSAQRSSETPSLDIHGLKQHLAPDQLLLAYFLYKERLVIFALTAHGFITREVADGARQIERLLPLLHAHLQPGGWPDPKQPPQRGIRQMLHKLYTLLIAPIQGSLPDSPGHLIIVPYGPLHTLPFHALYDGSRFLIEQFQVSYLPTSSLLARGASSSTAAPSRPPLIFGYSSKGQIQYTLEEARMLAQMLNAPCYLEEAASIARLNEQAPGSPLIHLATHGHNRLDAPNFSAITLADGRFNAIDAFSLDLRECELVTLSGCETGLALTGGGDEQIGLGRAFLAAGAATLVMSLWLVEDSATSRFMQLFYEHLQQGSSKVQALRAAYCALIQGDIPAHTHPYFWAAFHLVGDPGHLQH